MRIDKYLKILREKPELSDAAEKILSLHPEFNTVEQVMALVGGPSIYLYVFWVLQEAQKKEIRRLYFLARDGQIFYEVAKIICQYNKINIECRYLYCSRIAWRVPQYHLMGETCLDFICQRSMSLSIQKMFDRTLLPEKEIKRLSQIMGFTEEQRMEILDHDEVKRVREVFRRNSDFMNSVYEKSKEEYDTAILYFKQEGMFDGVRFALVDTGWVGSMQESLGMLLGNEMNQDISLEGFYFGMFRRQKKSKQKYYTFLFSAERGLKNKVIFNNNLLECMCGATDGMTMGYEVRGNRVIPRFASGQNLNANKWNISRNHAIIDSYVQLVCNVREFNEVGDKDDRSLVSSLMGAFMMRPDFDEAEVYGTYLFSDDMTENGVIELAPNLSQKDLFGEDLIPKVLKRIFTKNTEQRQTKSYWIEGSISRSRSVIGGWHRLNAMMWHLLQFLVYK